MNQEIEKTLEFDKIKELIGRYCVSGLGRSLAEQLRPHAEIARIEYLLDLCDEAKRIQTEGGSLPLGGLRDIRRLMEKARVLGSILEPEELLEIASTCKVIGNLRVFAKKGSEEYPMTAGIIENMSDFSGLERAISRCFDQEGKILDTASPKLSKIRRQLVAVRQRIITHLESILRSPQYRTAVQDNLITIRNNRYVIPIKQSHKGDISGVVQASSASGVTVFMEPAATVELNNQMRQLSDQETAEIRRILRELTNEIRESLPELEATVHALAQIDLLNAKATLCINLVTTKPTLNEEGYIDIAQARHPILQLRSVPEDDDLEKVVPIDFNIGRSFDTLVITGPNTGGKTVALKTVGLLTLMMQSGLHIPASEGSCMSVFKEVYADIGDEQSIEQNLSTFSSHMTRIIRITKEAGKSSLVLLDELGAGTEPSEGAALGRAILDFLHSKGAITVATTHHDSLKAHAHSQEGMENASVAFDSKTLKPTYKLQIGVPGSSNALRIANRLGLPEEISKAAESYLGSESLEVAELISNVEEMKQELEVEKRIAEEKIVSASRTQQEHERLLRQLKSRKRELEKEAMLEASNIIQKARNLVDATVSEIRKQNASALSVKRAHQSIAKAKREVSVAARQPKVEGRRPRPGELKVGRGYYLKNLGGRGVLLSLPDAKGVVQVRIGGARLNLPASELQIETSPGASQTGVAIAAARSRAYANIGASAKPNVPSSISLRGDRAEEALSKVDKYLDDAALAGLQSVSIVHGKGTGALRTAVAELLKDHPLVADFRLGKLDEGGSGVTIVDLV